MKKIRSTGKNKKQTEAQDKSNKETVKEENKQGLKDDKAPKGKVKVKITKNFGPYNRWEVVHMDKSLAEYHKSRVKQIEWKYNKAILENKSNKWLH